MSVIETLYSINGTSIRPVNADDIGFKMDWTGDAQEAELTVDNLILANEAKQIVLDHIDTLGVFEGIPIDIQVGGVNLEYYIDLLNSPKISGQGDSTIEVSVRKRKAVDYFRQQANGTSFESVNKTNPISLIDVPYLIVRDNQLEMLIMLGISAYTLTKALIEGVKSLAEAVADLTAASTPNTGVPPSVNTGAIISAALKVTAQTIYVAALVIAIIDLTKQIIELIFPPIRKLKASKVKELMVKGCAKLGYSFQSSILDEYSQLTICPKPLKKNQNSIFTNLFTLDNGSYTKGYPTASDSCSTVGSLIDFLEDWSQAKLRVVGNTVFLEEDDYWVLNSGVTITNTLNLQDSRENQWTYNTGESWKRYYTHYQTDPSDVHTLDKIDGTDCEYSTEPVTVVNSDLVAIKGVVDIGYPFAYGIRKEKLTIVEEACLPYARLADEVVQFFGGSSELESKIKGRVGVLMISQQYYSVTKLMYIVSGKQPSNYLAKIGANVIYQKYHTKNQVKENFKKIYNAEIPFSTANFEMLLDNNYVQDMQGNSLKISTFAFINEAKTAEIEYSEESTEGDNTQTILIDA